MKKIILFLFSLVGIAVITACTGSSPSWNVTLEQSPALNEKGESFIALKVTDESGLLVKGIDVNAIFEMTRMDHGVIEAELKEASDGSYQGNIDLPMDGNWQATIMMSDGVNEQENILEFEVEAIASSNSGSESGGAHSENTAALNEGERSSGFTAALSDSESENKVNASKESEHNAVGSEGSKTAIAYINGDEIDQDDLEFYEFINKLQIEMYRENDRKNYEGEELKQAMTYWDAEESSSKHKNTLLTQIIRLQAAALLAKEKGHTATASEVASEISKVKQIYAASPAATELIKQYGEEKFWTKQQSQYELIVLTSKVQNDVLDLVKQENPEAEKQEVNMLAQKKYEELLVSQVSTLNIQLN